MDYTTNLVPEIPVILSIEIICGVIWLYIWNYNADPKKFAFNYIHITQKQEWWRILSATLSHIQIMHLAFNLISLWNTGAVEKYLGSLIYFQLTFLLFMISNLSMVVCYYIMCKYFNKKEYVENMYAVGYSAILFGFMAFECVLMDGNMNVFGLDIPFYLGPFVLLVLISVLVPNASFIGHFAGIISGFVLGIKSVKANLSILFWLFFVQFIAMMIYSIYTTDLFGIATATNERLLTTNGSSRNVKMVNGVIVRGNDSV